MISGSLREVLNEAPTRSFRDNSFQKPTEMVLEARDANTIGRQAHDSTEQVSSF